MALRDVGVGAAVAVQARASRGEKMDLPVEIAEVLSDLWEPVVRDLVKHFDCHPSCPEGRRAVRRAREALG